MLLGLVTCLSGLQATQVRNAQCSHAVCRQKESSQYKRGSSPLTAATDYIRFYILHYQIKYQLLNMLKIQLDINQQYFKIVALHFIKSG